VEPIKIEESADCWVPGASLWVTTLEKHNRWVSIFDYKLNFQITKLLDKLSSRPSDQDDLLMIVPHGMLPTELVILISSWDKIFELKKIQLPYQTTLVRLFNPGPSLTLDAMITSKFQFEMVSHNAV